MADEISRRESTRAACVVGGDSRFGQSSKVAKVKMRLDGANDCDSGIDTSDSCDEKKTKGDRRAKNKAVSSSS